MKVVFGNSSVVSVRQQVWIVLRKSAAAIFRFRSAYLPQPVGVGKREVREGAFPLHKVPGRADVVVPRDHPLHGVADEIDVDGGGEIESELGFKMC